MKAAYLFAASLLAVAWSGASYAYLDPGTGSMLLQGLLAGIAGVAVVLRLYWYRVKSFWQGLFSRKPQQQSDEQASEQTAEKAES